MTQFRFYYPIEVRYADIDSFQHVNNARYFTYMEQARAHYLEALGLWDGQDLTAIGVILAQINCQFRRPIQYGDPVRVGAAVTQLGTKSLQMVYRLEDLEGSAYAEGQSTLVAYDHERQRSIRLPENWRAVIAAYEGLPSESRPAD